MRKFITFILGVMVGVLAMVFGALLFFTPKIDENGTLMLNVSGKVPGISYRVSDETFMEVACPSDNELFASFSTQPQIDIIMAGTDFQIFIDGDKNKKFVSVLSKNNEVDVSDVSIDKEENIDTPNVAE